MIIINQTGIVPVIQLMGKIIKSSQKSEVTVMNDMVDSRSRAQEEMQVTLLGQAKPNMSHITSSPRRRRFCISKCHFITNIITREIPNCSLIYRRLYSNSV